MSKFEYSSMVTVPRTRPQSAGSANLNGLIFEPLAADDYYH